MPKKPQTPARKAINTLAQGLAITIGSTLVVTLLTLVGAVSSYGELAGALVAFSTFQAIATAGLTYLMRAGVDRWREQLDSIELAPFDDEREG